MDISKGPNEVNRREIAPTPPGESYAPILEPGHTFASITDKISSIVLTRRSGPAGSSVSRSRSRW